MPIALFDKATNERLFAITLGQRDQLVAALEEEDPGQHDFYVDAAACDFLEGKVDADLLGKLRELLGVKPAESAAIEGSLEKDVDFDDIPETTGAGDDGRELVWREEA